MSKKASVLCGLRRTRLMSLAGPRLRLRVALFDLFGALFARFRRRRRGSADAVSGGGIRPREAGSRLRPPTVDLTQLTLRAGCLVIPFSPADLVNPEDFDPRALAWVVLQACCLRGIVFSTGRARRLADVLRLAARAGRLRPAGEGAHPERDIWVDPLGGVYDLTHLEIRCLPASAFGGPAPVPCAPTSGVG